MIQHDSSIRALPARQHKAAFCCLLFLPVLLLVFVIPPFQAPDEHRHFFRAYQIAAGTLLPHRRDSAAPEGRTVQAIHAPIGGTLPRALDDLLAATDAERLRFHPEERIDPGRIRAALSIRIAENDRVFLRFPHTTVYPPYAYLPQVVGIGLAGRFTDRALAQFYAARLANALAAMAMLALALFAAPGFAPLVAAFAAAPVVQFLAASLSLDAAVNGAALAFAALFFARKGSRTSSFAAETALLTVVCAKLAYAPLALLFLADGRLPPMQRALGATLPLVPALLWLWATRDLAVPLRLDLDLDAGGRLAGIVAAPLDAVGVLADDWRRNGMFYLRSMFGILGWLDRPLSPWHAAGAVLLLGAGAWASRRHAPQPAILSAAALAVVAASAALVQLALLLSFTPVGSDLIQGVQGRYFLPLAPLALLALRHAWRGRAPEPSFAAAALFYAAVGASSLATLWSVLAAYYG